MINIWPDTNTFVFTKNWLRKICNEENWSHDDIKKEKVLSWVEQRYLGGPKMLLGGLYRLLEYMMDKYEVSRNLTASDVEELIKKSKQVR